MINVDVKKIVDRVKKAQAKLQSVVQNKTWVEEVRKYAETQGSEVKKLLKADFKKLRTFLEKEKVELEKFQKQLPGEIQKVRTFLQSQKTELERLLKTVARSAKSASGRTTKPTSTKKKRSGKSSTTKTAGAKSAGAKSKKSGTAASATAN